MGDVRKDHFKNLKDHVFHCTQLITLIRYVKNEIVLEHLEDVFKL